MQVYLGEEELALLDETARTAGSSRSALLRRSLRRTFDPASNADRLRALEASTGGCSERSFTDPVHMVAIRGVNQPPFALGEE